MLTRSLIALAAVAAVAGLAGTATAQSVSLVDTSSIVSGSLGNGGTFGAARSRLGVNNWDLGVGRPGVVVGVNQFAQQEVTSATSWTGSFALSFDATTRVLTYSMTPTGGSTLTASYDLDNLASSLAKSNSFNTFQFSGNTGGNGGSISMSNVVFNSGITGTIPNLSSSNSFNNFYLYSTSDLSSTSFSLSGDLSMSRGTSGSLERPSFNIGLEQSNITLIPLPPAAWAGLGGVAMAFGVVQLRRRRLANA